MKCVKWRSLEKVMRGIKGYFVIREWPFIFNVNDKLTLIVFVIRELNVLTFLVNCKKRLMFSVNWNISVIFLYPPKKMCTGGIIRTFSNSHSLADASVTHTHTLTNSLHTRTTYWINFIDDLCRSTQWGAILWATNEHSFHRVNRNFGLSVFFSKWQTGRATLE